MALAAGYVVQVFLPAEVLAPLARALAGPYDPSGFGPIWLGTFRGLVTAGAVFLAAWGWGRRCSADALFATALGLVALGLTVFGLGVLGLLAPPLLLLVLLGGLLRVRPRRPRTFPAWPGFGEGLAGLGVVALGLVYLGPTLAPEAGWDALTYHLRAPSHFLAARRIHLLAFSLWSFYPFLSEMWFTLGLMFAGDPGAKLINFGFLPLTAWALVRAGNEAGPRVGWLAALLFTALPVAAAVASQTYNDLEPAYFGLLGVWAAVRGGPRGRLVSAVLGGAALGCKYTGAWGLVVSVGLWAWELGRLRPARYPALLVPLGAAVLVVLPWPLRDWLWTGNPVYPIAPRWFPVSGWNPYFTPAQAASIIPVAEGVALGARLGDLLRFPLESGWRIRGIGVTLSPLLAGLLPAWALLGRADHATRQFAVAGGVACGLWVVLRAGEGRYLLPPAALLAIPAAAGARVLASRGRGWAWLVAATVATTVGCQAAGWIGFVSGTYFPWRVAAGLERRDTYLGRALLPNHEFYPMATMLNARLPARARILLFSDITSYYLEREVVFDTQQVTPPIALRLAGACRDPAALRRRLRQLGVEYVLHSSGRLIAFQHDCHCLAMSPEATDCYGRFWRTYAALELELGSLRLFRLRGDAEAARAGREPFTAWPGVQEVELTAFETARAAGDEAGARAAAERLRALAPDLAEAPLRLAELAARSRRFGDAARELAVARRLGADSGAYWMLVATVRGAARDRPGAFAAAREGVARWPVPQVWASYVAHAFNAGQFLEANRALAEALRLAPFDPEVRRVAQAVRSAPARP